MSRDDSLLYTGMTSASFQKAQEKKKERQSERTEERAKLQPAAEIVFSELAKDKAMLGEVLLSLVDPDTPDNQVKEHLNAVRMHRGWIADLEARLKLKLRLQKPKKAKGDDNADL